MQSMNQSHRAYGVTHVKGKEFVYTWSIHNFDSLIMGDEISLDSPLFDTNVEKQISWYLRLSLSNENKNYLAIVLYMKTVELNCQRRAHLILSIIDHKGKEIKSVRSLFSIKHGDLSSRQFLNFVSTEYLYNSTYGYIDNGILMIKCKIFFLDEISQEPLSKLVQISKFCNCNLKDLFETKKLSDVTLTVGGQKFETHKCILAAQSKVFSAMFEHNMKENNENTVEIDDIEPQVIQEMLQFIYGAKANKFEDASSLFIAADKYAIDELKSICEEQLTNDMNAENVGKTLILADRYKADTLKKYAIQFIIKNPEKIDFEQFKKDVEPYSPLLIDMLLGLM